MIVERGVVYHSSDGELKRALKQFQEGTRQKEVENGQQVLHIHGKPPQKDIMEFFVMKREEEIPQ